MKPVTTEAQRHGGNKRKQEILLVSLCPVVSIFSVPLCLCCEICMRRMSMSEISEGLARKKCAPCEGGLE